MTTERAYEADSVRWNPKLWLGTRARRMIKAAVDLRFDDLVNRQVALMTHLQDLTTRAASMAEDLTNRMVALEAAMARNELEVAALRQQIDESLDFLRIQHEVNRDTLEETKITGAELRAVRDNLEAGSSPP
jgi:hypothetical protein